MQRFLNLSRLVVATVIAVGAALPFQLRAQDTVQPARITGLVVAKAERTMVEGKNGINVTFDKPSAERLRQFTSGAVGRRMVIFVNQRKLAGLRLLDPLLNGNVLLTGKVDNHAAEALFAPGAVVDLQLE